MFSMSLKPEQAKAFFFDRLKVLDKAKATTLRGLSKAGAFVRRTAKGSIRKKRGISQPGSPPASHTGLLGNFLYFGLDPQKQTVFVGPVRLNHSDGSAPGTLERGGLVADSKTKRFRRYRARPFMLPALKKESPKFPGFWANEIK